MIKKITQNIYVSGRNEVDNKENLLALGINAILNVAWEVTDPTYSPEDFVMVKVGLRDSTENLDAMKSLAIVALDTLLKEGKTVLVHCMAGASRSPYIIFRWIAEHEKRTIQEIYSEFMPQFGPGEITIGPLNNV